MTFRELFEKMSGFVAQYPDHEALDQRVVVRVAVDDDLHVGGLDACVVDAGCSETFALVLDASDAPDEDPVEELEDASSGPIADTSRQAACRAVDGQIGAVR